MSGWDLAILYMWVGECVRVGLSRSLQVGGECVRVGSSDSLQVGEGVRIRVGPIYSFQMHLRGRTEGVRNVPQGHQFLRNLEQNIWRELDAHDLQGGHRTGKTGNLVLTFSKQGKHTEFCCNTGKIFDTQGKYF